jgi:ATP-dependent DNA ligase
MRHKTHAELWRATPFRRVQKIILFGLFKKNNRSEGIALKRKHSMYRSGRWPDWLKMRNADAPAVKREAEEEWSKKGRR